MRLPDGAACMLVGGGGRFVWYSCMYTYPIINVFRSVYDAFSSHSTPFSFTMMHSYFFFFLLFISNTYILSLFLPFLPSPFLSCLHLPSPILLPFSTVILLYFLSWLFLPSSSIYPLLFLLQALLNGTAVVDDIVLSATYTITFPGVGQADPQTVEGQVRERRVCCVLRSSSNDDLLTHILTTHKCRYKFLSIIIW